jgi:integrase
MPYTEKRGDGEFPWRVRWLLPERGPQGQARYDSASGFADQESAYNHGLDMESDLRRGVRKGRRSDATFRQWAAEWLPAYSRKRRPTTVANRYNDLHNHLLPAFGDTPLGEITWWSVTLWAQEQTCAKSSTAMRISLLSQILTAAVDARKLENNPVAGRRLHGSSRKRQKEKAFPSPAQVQVRVPAEALRDNVISVRYARMCRILVLTFGWTGLRSGEAYGLDRERCGLWRRDVVDGAPWRRRVLLVDPEQGALKQHYDPQARATVKYIGEPKSDSGAREVDLPPFLADLLDEHLADWPHRRVFCEQDGSDFDRARFGRYLKIVADGRAGRPARTGWPAVPEWQPIVPGLTPHGLRHGHYTWLREDGIPDVMVDDRMGHEGRGMDGVYAHPTPGMRKRVVDRLEERFVRARRHVEERRDESA